MDPDQRLFHYMWDIEEEESIRRLLALRESQSVPRNLSPEPREIVLRDRIAGNDRLMADYFVENPVWNNRTFERRFRMSHRLFDRLCGDLQQHDRFWVRKADCCGQIGLSTHQKMTAALRQLAYGTSADILDEYVRIGETTALRTLKYFIKNIIELYATEYLRPPNRDELKVILSENEARGFPGCIGSIDGMHWAWKNCPSGFAGQYTGKEKKPTMVLEAVASQNLRIWHAFFGTPGALNDINLLHRSHLFDGLLAGASDTINYTINGHDYHHGYYLCDSIYPPWSTLVSSIKHPQDGAFRHFAKLQESAQKDIERTFGVLQARWHVLTGGCWLWQKHNVMEMMLCCIILHNMIVEERSPLDPFLDETDTEIIKNHQDPALTHTWANYLQNNHDLHNPETHAQLREDLKAYNWLLRGDKRD